MSEKKRRFPFSFADLVLILLVAACIVTAVFAPRIRALFGESERCELEVTFLVENVTEAGRNHPRAGEALSLVGGKAVMGTILSVSEESNLYQSVENPDEQVTILTLTCRATMEGERTENGYLILGQIMKNGTRLAAQTETASFEMTVISVKEGTKGA